MRSSTVMWSILANITNVTSDNIPLFVSANFDCSKFSIKDGEVVDVDALLPMRKSDNVACEVLRNKGVIVLYKGGACVLFKPSELTLRNIFGRFGELNIPRGLQYLTPWGINQ